MLRPAADSPNDLHADSRAGAGWTVVVPAKSLDKAKSRMTAELPDPARRDLVRAMLQDVVAAAGASSLVRTVGVVTGDSELAGLARRAGAVILAEFPSTPDPAGSARTESFPYGESSPDIAVVPGGDHTYRRAAAVGLTWARSRGDRIAVLASDLPGLTPDELTAALTAADRYERGFVIDADDAGTTLATFTAARGLAGSLPTFFGVDSAREFARSGAHRISDVMGRGGLIRDVDSVAHLGALDYLGEHTRRVVDSWLADRPHAPEAPPLGKLME